MTLTVECKAVSRLEAAQRLGIHIRSVDAMVKRGELAAVRYCSRTFILSTELERLLTPTPRVDKPLSYEEARQADTQET